MTFTIDSDIGKWLRHFSKVCDISMSTLLEKMLLISSSSTAENWSKEKEKTEIDKYFEPLYRKFLNSESESLTDEELNKLKYASVNAEIRDTIPYNIWKYSVIERDGFQCVECGSNKELCVHHIKMLSSIIEESKADSIQKAINIPLVFDKTNGKTLCRNCHNKKGLHKRKELDKLRNER